MSTLQWRWSLISLWVALSCVTFAAIDSMAARSWLVLLVSGVIPPAMLLWLWNDEQPVLIGSLHRRQKRL